MNTALSALPVAVDAMGGDFGPAVAVDGSVSAARELNIKSIIVGDEAVIVPKLKALGFADDARVEVVHAPEYITMDDSASQAIRGKTKSSIRVAFELVRSGRASAVVSPGNTGAVMAAGVFVSGTLPGIARPAIASLIPRVGDTPPAILLDSGANIDCHALQLVQFALMGSYYAVAALNLESPKVALLSNGTEASKGTDILRSAALMLSDLKELNFVGYVEGRDLGRTAADVIVCDGFVGNIVLKTMEGTVELVLDWIKYGVEHNLRGRFGMWLAKPMIKSLFRNTLDPSSYGGAPLLGLNDIAIVCHGSSNSRAIMNGIRVARRFVDESLTAKLSQAVSVLDMPQTGVYDDGMWNRMGQRFEKNKQRGAKKGKTADAAPENPTQDGRENE